MRRVERAGPKSLADPSRFARRKQSHHPVHSLNDRIRLITELIVESRTHPVVRGNAIAAVTERCGDDWCVAERDRDGEINALFNHLRKQYRYVNDPDGRDYYQAADVTLEMGGGDCDDAVILFASHASSLGYAVWLRVIETVHDDTWAHIYCLVVIGDRLVPIDLSEPGAVAGWEVSPHLITRHAEFEIPPG